MVVIWDFKLNNIVKFEICEERSILNLKTKYMKWQLVDCEKQIKEKTYDLICLDL